jgi:hypothetical protein
MSLQYLLLSPSNCSVVELQTVSVQMNSLLM